MENMMKRMNKRLVTVTLMFMMVVCLATGCGSSESANDNVRSNYSQSEDYGFGASYDSAEKKVAAGESYNSVQESESPAAEETAEESSSDSEMGGQSDVDNFNSTQKIIKCYDYRYETEKFDDAYAYLKKQIGAYGGYIASSDLTGNGSSTDYRTLYLTARIPAEKSDAFISEMGSLGTVVRQSESAEDVTLQYSDTESRIKSLKAEQESLNKLLEQADSLETIIALQDRLTEVRYELENYQSRIKLYDDLISYSTVDICLEEVNYTVEVDNGTFFSRVITGLERSIRDVAAGLISFLEWIIIHLPYFVVWGIIIFIIVKIIRKLRKRGKEKKMKKQLAKQQELAQKMMVQNQESANMNNSSINDVNPKVLNDNTEGTVPSQEQ